MSLFNNSRSFIKSCFSVNFPIFILFGIYSTSIFAIEENILIPPSNIATEISAIIAAKQHPNLTSTDFSNRAENINRLYELMGFQLIWFGSESALRNNQAALSLLQHAAEEGLNPAQYDYVVLQRNLDAAKQNLALDIKQLALFDTAMSIEVLRYMYDLHFGRVDPHGIDFKFALRNKTLDLTELLKKTLSSADFSNLNAVLEPPLKQYRLLKQALADYRTVATEIGSIRFEYPLKGTQLPWFRRYLQGVGDLPNTGELDKTAHLSVADSAAIKKFQHRHFLAESGAADKQTLAALNTPLSQSIGQIELAMERLRWLPEMNDGPGVLVNIPAFQLWAFDSMESMDEATMKMRVVVGEATKTQTPVLMSQIQYLEFMPQWNVPFSIVKNELIAKIVRNKNYLRSQNMEIVSNADGNAQGQMYSVSLIDELKNGNVRIRQRSGKRNALGKVKFIFPNEYNVYLHDTQANALFQKTRRDFSHGCVRVENPTALAEFVLKDHEKWDRGAIKQAMQQENQQRVFLKKPLPVLIFYTTAFFESPGQLRFYPDIYGYDTVLRQTLAKPVEVADSSLFMQEAAVNMTGLE